MMRSSRDPHAHARVPRWLVLLLGVALVVAHAVVLRRAWSHLATSGALVSGGVLALLAVKHAGLLAALGRRMRARDRRGS